MRIIYITSPDVRNLQNNISLDCFYPDKPYKNQKSDFVFKLRTNKSKIDKKTGNNKPAFLSIA